MSFKIFGAVLVLVACGWAGFAMAAAIRREELALQQLCFALEYMKGELQFSMSSLPSLCKKTANRSAGVIAAVLNLLSTELDKQYAPEAGLCLENTLAQMPGLPASVRENLRQLGRGLGHFDLAGQLSGLETCLALCRQDLACLNTHREERIRSRRTLGLCAGAALAILLL